jgi:anti-sigma factor RsiW
MICADAERDLDAYVDGELDTDGVAAMRQHLVECVGCRERLAGREALGRLVRSTGYHAAPDRLRADIAARAARSTTPRRLTLWAAAAMLLISIGGAVALVRTTISRGDAIVEEVVDGHVRSLMGEHLFDVRSTDQHTVKPWFLGKLDFAPPVVDLAAVGFPLVGGRLDYLGGRPVAALVYQRQKHTINVFVSPDETADTARLSARSIRGFHVRQWGRDRMAFRAVSDLNDAELTEFARALGAPPSR